MNPPIRPEDSRSLPGMESADTDRATAAGIQQAEDLAAIMRTPKADLSRKAGEMEREAPLFFGQINPTLF